MYVTDFMALAHRFSFIVAACAPWLDVAFSFCSCVTIKYQFFSVKIICWRRQPGFPSIFLTAQLCGFKITLVYQLIWNNLKIQYFIYIWDEFTVPSLMDTVQDRNHYFLVIPVITLNKPRAVKLFGKLQLLTCGTKTCGGLFLRIWWFFCVLRELIFEIRTDWF